MSALLEIHDLSVDFETSGQVLHAVRGVSFELAAGEMLGIVGESGCGKSTLSRAILKLIERPGRIAGGRVLFEGADLLSLSAEELRLIRGGQISTIFQDPSKSLNPVMTVGRQIGAAVLAHRKVPKQELRETIVELLGNLGVPDPAHRIDQYPHELSGGMRQRVMIAMALANRPKLIIADEPTTALDVTVQAQVLDLLREINAEMGTSIALISHNLGVVAELCRRVIVLYAGRVVEVGPTDRVFGEPRHPYTRALLGSLPAPGQRGRRLTPVSGAPPAVTDELRGCAFAPRCPLREARCSQDPPLLRAGAGQQAACWVTQDRGARSEDEHLRSPA